MTINQACQVMVSGRSDKQIKAGVNNKSLLPKAS
ncbi:MAG: hypothetical protein ACI8SZ_000596 [Colwellia sp.]|jgi:hypothetical protein